MRLLLLLLFIYIPIHIYSQEVPPDDFFYNRVDSAICNDQIQRLSFLNDNDTTEYFIEYSYSDSNDKVTEITTGFLKSRIPIGKYKTIDSSENLIYCLDFDTIPIGYQELEKIAIENNIDLNSKKVYYNHKSVFDLPNDGNWTIPLPEQYFSHYSEHEELWINGITGETETSSFTIMFQPVYSEKDYVEPRFIGGEKGLKKYLDEMSIYPISESGEKWVQISFEIDNTGKTQNVIINCTNSTNRNKEAIRLVESMPNWIPAQDRNGKKIDINWKLKIMFK